MRLSDHRGTSLEFHALYYQFPEITRSEYDSNWLVIGGRIEKDGAAWKFQDPCLLTNELLLLAEWFEARAQDFRQVSESSFIEPALSFTWANGALRVDLGWGCSPEWAPSETVEEFYLTFSPSPQDLMQAAEALREDLKKFPIRAES